MTDSASHRRSFLLACSCLLVWVFHIPVLAQTDNSLYFTNISLDEGLSQLSVTKILQDSKGYMWFGTRNGLDRYDGTAMKHYRHLPDDPESLINNQITALCEEGDSLMWIGNSHGLNKLDLRTDRMHSFRDRQFPELVGGTRAIFVDSMDRRLIGSLHGLFCLSDDLKHLVPISVQGFPDNVPVTSIIETRGGRIIVGSTGFGLFVFDQEMSTVEQFDQNRAGYSQATNNIESLFEDSHGILWAASKTGGLSRLDLTNGTLTRFTTDNSPLSTNDVRCLGEIDGTLYIGSSDGLFALDQDSGEMYALTNEYTHKGDLSSYSVWSICTDIEGGLWVGTYSGGVNYYNRYLDQFHLYAPSSGMDNLIGIYSHIIPTDGKSLFITTEGSGILEYNLSDKSARSLLYDSSNIHSRNTIKSVLREGDKVWFGTSLGYIYIFDLQTKEFTQYCKIPENTSIYSIERDNDGNLWLATASVRGLGLVRITKDKQMQHTFTSSQGDMQFKALRVLKFFDADHLLIGGKYDGLMVYDIRTGNLVRYGSNESGSRYLPTDYVTAIEIDSRGYIWLGLFGGGIAMLTIDEGVRKLAGASDGLASNDVFMIVKDKHENIWIASDRYISQYDPIERHFSNYNVGPVGVGEFTPHCGAMLPDGDICFSASNGFVLFNPDQLQANSFIPPVVLTDLYVNNELISPSANSPLSVILDDSDGIKLKHNQNNLIISYSALNYIYPGLNQYAYRMRGQDSDWNYVGGRTEAIFPSMRPGRYVFEVKASNNDGLWNPEARSLPIVISPPFWLTWYMKLLYALLIILLPSSILYSAGRKRQLENELLLEQESSRRQEELHQTALRMYTNLSHELRTPLTLIESPVEELLADHGFSPETRNKLHIVHSNAKRIDVLVNQIMDFTKTQAGKMRLRVAENDFNAYLEEICCAFRYVANSKNITLSFNGSKASGDVWYDESILEKVVFNLLSNALKYTPHGGTVSVTLEDMSKEDLLPRIPGDIRIPIPDSPYSFLSVSDNGCGIPEDEKGRIFEPFYQSSRSSSMSVPGTGIGLSLTASLVSLHKGLIWIEDNAGGGSTFHVAFPSSKDAYTEDEKDKSLAGRHRMEVIPSDDILQLPALERRYLILLAEDDNDVREYVRECLERYFDVIVTGNGDDALRMVNDRFPDLIVSDVIMPGINGLELCAEVKGNLETGHIPVILMTARSLAENVIEGLTAGADDYVIKPFNIDVLVHRIHNILISREKLKKLYGQRLSPDEPGISFPSADDRFTQKFFGIIDENISNPELCVDMICREIGMSRTNLYRKLKVITYFSPGDLIRIKRLEYATELLRKSSYTIAEVATFSGFNSQAYFSSCFKAEYKCTPSEYLIKYRK